MEPSSDDVTLAHVVSRVDDLRRDVQKLIEVTKKSSRLTIMDGIALGVGMFIALPLMITLLWLLLSLLGISLLPLLPHR